MENKQKKFKLSFFTIRIKLLGIVLSFVTIGILMAIILASKFFRTDTRIRITENSLNLTKILSEQINYDLNQKIKIIANNFKNDIKDIDYKDIFNENKEILYFAQLDKDKLKKEFFNNLSMKKNKVSKRTLQRYFKKNKKSFRNKKVRNNIFVFNASSKKSVLMGMIFSLKGKKFLIIISPARTLKIIKDNAGFFDFFVINTQGNLILHSNEKSLTQKNTDWSTSNIVKKMLESNLSIKTFEYKDNDGEKYVGSFKKNSTMNLIVASTTKSKIAFSAVNAILYRNLGIAGLIILIINFISYFFAKTIITHILRLVKGTKEIEQGNYSISLAPKYKDEIGLLTHSFNNMTKGLEEKERVKSAFGKFVNEELVQKSLKGEIKLTGVQKNIAILFCDIRNFTSISENLSPNKVVSFLNDYFTDMVACIEKTNGLVDKYIGDAVMAHWGSIETEKKVKKNDASYYSTNAIESALLMRTAVLNFNQKYKGKHPSIHNGFGIHYGPSVVGQMGTENRLEFTAIGDSVNLASRLEGLCKKLKMDIIISSETHKYVKNQYKFVEFKKVPIKGKKESTTIYGVLGKIDDPNTPKNIKELNKILKNSLK